MSDYIWDKTGEIIRVRWPAGGWLLWNWRLTRWDHFEGHAQ